MDIRRRLREAQGLTPTERQLADAVLSLGERVQDYSIKELARAASCSVATVHRLCRKVGVEGFKELKVEMARSTARGRLQGAVDINFPFSAGWGPRRVATSLESLYVATLEETLDLLDMDSLARASELVARARQVDIYTESHNLYPANMFLDRLLSIGKAGTCHENYERQVRTALASDQGHVAILISYSGYSSLISSILPVLAERSVPSVLVGTPAAARRNPGVDVYLCVSDSERYQGRITQFASHLAVHYVLDTLFGCVFARSWDRSLAFLEASVTYTRKPGMERPTRAGRQDAGEGATGGGGRDEHDS